MTTTPTTTIEPAVDVLAGLYAAVATGDAAAAAARIHPDAVLHVPGTHPYAGDHVGRDAILAFIARSTDVVGGGERVEVLDLLGGSTHGAALCDVVGERDGEIRMRNRTVHLFRLADGLIEELWFHNWDQSVVDAFWSET